MSLAKDFNKTDFIDYLAQNNETGQAYLDLIIGKPYDISPNEFTKLESFTITFDNFDKFYILRHKLTNELFLGDMNLGGHGARCRIIKVERDDFFNKSAELIIWYDNWSSKIWKK